MTRREVWQGIAHNIKVRMADNARRIAEGGEENRALLARIAADDEARLAQALDWVAYHS